MRARDQAAPNTNSYVNKKPTAEVSEDEWHQTALRIGLYFGTFDPVHENHISVAKYAIENHNINHIVFIANPDNRFKPFVAPLADRVALLEARVALENKGPLGEQMSVYRHLRPDQLMNWQGRAIVNDAVKTQWADKGVTIKTVQIMGQDSFEEQTAQNALALRHVRDQLRRNLLIFPRSGGVKHIAVTSDLRSIVEIAALYRDPFPFSSTDARQAIGKGETPVPKGDVAPGKSAVCIHPVVLELIAARKLYQPITASPDKTVILLIGGPGCGKGTLGKFIASTFKTAHYSCGDYYRASCVCVISKQYQY